MNFADWTTSATDAAAYAAVGLPISLALRELVRIVLFYGLVTIGMGLIIFALISLLQDLWRRPV